MRPYDLLKPVLFSLSPETAHRFVHGTGKHIDGTVIADQLRHRYAVEDERLAVSVFGARFGNPVGVAAGFDKNAHIPDLLGALGFGHVEIGGVTAEAQEGNPRPRLFRLPPDEALINRMGFNNDGADRIADRLAHRSPPNIPIGVNIGKSKSASATQAPADYRYTYERLAPHGDFFVVNVSSPNTPGLRKLQQRDQLDRIITELQAADASPLLVKLSPDLTEAAISDVLSVVEERNLDGVIATNTTTDRPDTLRHPNRVQSGGLSGKPLTDRATTVVRFVARETDVPVIGVGGIASADDAYERIRAGASLVQLYTGLVYEGPSLANRINRGLLDRLERDGFESVSEAVGADLE